ncbi:MAG: peroxiredoxin family protein [Aquificaceae bacterium]|jgi:peroxiredoxin|uniref:peroxiredoxin family protein n=1 Tax=Hydrogenobacter sp. Uz 6-8 TaxID=3384828 RepID=UPI000F26D7C1|nr:MAG: TlpA family protein disulfide reductase [Aquificota bacterium]
MPLKLGEKAKDFELPEREGHFHSLAETVGYKLLVFYKVTCPACQLTLPFVERLHKLYGHVVTVWGIAQDPEHAVREFAKKYGLTFPQLVDYPDYWVSVDYDVQIVPTIYLIDPGGQVDFVSHSFVKSELRELNERLASISGQAPEDIFAGQRVPELKPG